MSTLTEATPSHVKTRVESDSMGKIEVPANVYWGAQTQRSLLHFNIGRDTMPPELIHAFGTLKKACALVNQDLGKLPADKAALIVQADKIGFGIIDAPPREGLDMDIGFVPCRNGNRRSVPFKKTIIKGVYGLHIRDLEMQTRLGDRIPNRFSKLGDDDLFSLVNCVTRPKQTRQDQERKESHQSKEYLFHYLPSPGLVERGRIGSSCRKDSSTMIFCPTCGRMSPIVSR